MFEDDGYSPGSNADHTPLSGADTPQEARTARQPADRYEATHQPARNRRIISFVFSIAIHIGACLIALQYWVFYTPSIPPQAPHLTVVELSPPVSSPPTPDPQPSPPPVRVDPVKPAPDIHSSKTAPVNDIWPVEAIPPAATDSKFIDPILPQQDSPPPPSIHKEAEDSFEGRLLARIEQFRRYPAEASLLRQQGIVHIQFRMNRDGKVLAIAVNKSSGIASLDKEALATVRRAQPLPKIPDDRPDVLTISVPVEFFLKSGGRN